MLKIYWRLRKIVENFKIMGTWPLKKKKNKVAKFEEKFINKSKKKMFLAKIPIVNISLRKEHNNSHQEKTHSITNGKEADGKNPKRSGL